MISIAFIRKNGDVETKTLRGMDEDTLYKKCGFSNNESFGKIHTFQMDEYKVSLFSKKEGKSNLINKFELPPPIDTTLFYGSIAVICHSGFEEEDDSGKMTGFIHYTGEQWTKDYETLMGGFEDLNNEEEEEEDELQDYPEEMKTSQGYLKDGFIVEDSNSHEDDDSDSYESDSENSESSESESDEELEEEDYLTE